MGRRDGRAPEKSKRDDRDRRDDRSGGRGGRGGRGGGKFGDGPRGGGGGRGGRGGGGRGRNDDYDSDDDRRGGHNNNNKSNKDNTAKKKEEAKQPKSYPYHYDLRKVVIAALGSSEVETICKEKEIDIAVNSVLGSICAECDKVCYDTAADSTVDKEKVVAAVKTAVATTTSSEPLIAAFAEKFTEGAMEYMKPIEKPEELQPKRKKFENDPVVAERGGRGGRGAGIMGRGGRGGAGQGSVLPTPADAGWEPLIPGGPPQQQQNQPIFGSAPQPQFNNGQGFMQPPMQQFQQQPPPSFIPKQPANTTNRCVTFVGVDQIPPVLDFLSAYMYPPNGHFYMNTWAIKNESVTVSFSKVETANGIVNLPPGDISNLKGNPLVETKVALATEEEIKLLNAVSENMLVEAEEHIQNEFKVFDEIDRKALKKEIVSIYFKNSAVDKDLAALTAAAADPKEVDLVKKKEFLMAKIAIKKDLEALQEKLTAAGYENVTPLNMFEYYTMKITEEKKQSVDEETSKAIAEGWTENNAPTEVPPPTEEEIVAFIDKQDEVKTDPVLSKFSSSSSSIDNPTTVIYMRGFKEPFCDVKLLKFFAILNVSPMKIWRHPSNTDIAVQLQNFGAVSHVFKLLDCNKFSFAGVTFSLE